ncbi:TolC family protein [Moraxella sp. ZJ142]|uniref:TolC family protein n=1 Tax=Moraxella marmotae TaxID=3344520 RepID=UPI0035D3F4CB
MIHFFCKRSVHTVSKKLRLTQLAVALVAASVLPVAHADANPLQVNQLISLAVQTHPLVGAAVADRQAATEGVTAAKLGYLPTPSLSSQYNDNDGNVTRFAINQPLWTGGKLTADVNRAINDDKAANAKIMERQNEVAKNTIDVWQSYIYALSLQELYANNLQQLAEFEAMMKRRVAQGVSAKIELDLITNRILQDQNSLQGAIEQQRIAEARLQQMIGVPVGMPSNVNIAEMAKQVKAQSQNYGELAFSEVSENHPSIIRQRFEIEAARYEVKSQRASQMPTVYVQYQNDYNHRNHRFEDNFTVGVSYNPGAGFSNIALARASESRVQSLIQSQEASRRSVMENIQTQYQQFVSARDQELSLTAAVAGAQIVLNSYRRQFIAGRKSWLEVLNAVREQSQYEQQLRQVQAQMVANFYKLQVDFALMPWQQQSIDFIKQPSTEFRPFQYAKNELDEYFAKKQSAQQSMPIATADSPNSALPDTGPMVRSEPEIVPWEYDEIQDGQTAPNAAATPEQTPTQNLSADETSQMPEPIATAPTAVIADVPTDEPSPQDLPIDEMSEPTPAKQLSSES